MLLVDAYVALLVEGIVSWVIPSSCLDSQERRDS